jgi:hypothetical protein
MNSWLGIYLVIHGQKTWKIFHNFVSHDNQFIKGYICKDNCRHNGASIYHIIIINKIIYEEVLRLGKFNQGMDIIQKWHLITSKPKNEL